MSVKVDWEADIAPGDRGVGVFAFWRQLVRRLDRRRRPKITLLIPFASDDPARKRAFHWLLRYWRHELPGVQIVIGHSKAKPFSKTRALNDAVRKARGRILVILDADAYLEGAVIARCAERILEEARAGHRLWYVPYRHLYRLNEPASSAILSSDPKHPLRYAAPPPPALLDVDITKNSYGHRYGAMCMILPREAYDALGCFDERFAGWGGEDISILRALDTLWAKHKTINGPIWHLWHPTLGATYRSRRWVEQPTEHPNDALAMRYHRATRKPGAMRELVDEACAHRAKGAHR